MLAEMRLDFTQRRISLLSVTNLSFHVNFTLTKHGARTVKLYTRRNLNVPTKSVRAITACQETQAQTEKCCSPSKVKGGPRLPR